MSENNSKNNDNVVEVLTDGAICLMVAKHNATHFITNILGLEQQMKVNNLIRVEKGYGGFRKHIQHFLRVSRNFTF